MTKLKILKIDKLKCSQFKLKLVRGQLANGGLVCPDKKFSNNVHGTFGIILEKNFGGTHPAVQTKKALSNTSEPNSLDFFPNGKSQ